MYKWLMIAVVAVTASTGLLGCKDTDDNAQPSNPDTQHQAPSAELAQDRAALAALLTQLTGQELADTADIRFEDRTFEPTYGSVRDESKPLERWLLVDDADQAEAYFRALAGMNSSYVKDTPGGCTIDMTNLDSRKDGTRQNLGTLTFHRAEASDGCVAYADVSIDCIPGLRTIVYKDSTQWGKNAFWKSPAHRGDVFQNDGRYFICVRESHGTNWPSEHGVLLCMEPGKGSDYETIYSDEDNWGAWHPASQILPGALESAILDYMRLSAGEGNFTRTKQKILKKDFGRQVFPSGSRFSWSGDDNYTYAVKEGIAGEGFDTQEKDYSHHAGIWTYTDSQNSFSEYDRAKWGDIYAIVVRDATEGSWEGPFAGHERRLHYMAFPYRCIGTLGAFSGTYTYYSADTNGSFWNTVNSYFERFMNGKLVYTCRGVSFTDKIPDGFRLVNI